MDDRAEILDPAHPEHALLLRLAAARIPGLGTRGAPQLIEALGSVERLFTVTRAELLAHELRPSVCDAVVGGRDAALQAAAREWATLRAAGAFGVGFGLPGYPAWLAGIHDPPLFLAGHGALTPEDARAVAVVGARRATPGGRELAFRLASELAAAGVTVVSGLARGIDRAAHEGALAAGGRTLAVLGSGLLCVHPPAHRPLAQRIAAQGAVLSELEPRQTPTKWTFPQRNRVVAGLSRGVVVVQAGDRSGALITADLALQFGRDVLAVPGAVYDPLARGTNRLLKQGAAVAETAQDVLDVVFEVRAGPDPDAPAPEADATPEERLLAALPGTTPELAARSGLKPGELLGLLGRLQLERRIKSTPAGYALTQPAG